MGTNYRVVTADNLIKGKDKLSIEAPSVTCFGLVTCWVKGWQLETRCPIEDYFKLWVLEFNKVNPCAHVVANLVSKTRPWNCQKLENLLGKLGFSFSKNPIFLTQNSIFFNGFPLSSTSFCFLQWLSSFPQWFFCFPRNRRKSIYGGKYMKDRYSSFVFPATPSPSFVIPAN